MKKQLIALALLAVSSCAALAQSACPQIIDGRVLTAAQWNNCFTRKQDGLGFVPVNKAGDVLTGKLTAATPSTDASGLNIGQGAAPTTPINGDVWLTTAGLFYQANGVTSQLPSTNLPNTWTAAQTFSANVTLGAGAYFTGRVDATISADQNNWTPTGTGPYATSSIVYVDGGVADRNITGLAGGAAGRDVLLINKGSTNSIVLKNQSGSSSAANQFLLPADVTMPPNTSIPLTYDGTTSVWRPASRALANSGVTAGVYGSATQASQVTVDVAGRLTAAANVTVTPALSSITGFGTNVGAFLATPSSANLLAALSDKTGSGLAVFGTSPTISGHATIEGVTATGATGTGKFVFDTAPVLGAVTVTSVNKVGITAPASSATLTISDGQTLTTTTTTSVGKGQYVGTATNDNATAGNIGEYLSTDTPVGSPVTLTTATSANIASVSLTAGDWDVWGTIRWTGNASTTVTSTQASISATSATIDTTDGRISTTFHNGQAPFGSITLTTNVLPVRISLSGTTSLFLVAQEAFGTSTATAYGIIQARRAR